MDWPPEVLSSIMSALIVAAAITFASMFTLMLTRNDRHRERREHQAAEVKMLLDAHMNLWRGLRQMEAHATGLPKRQLPGDSHALLADDFRWLRDVLRNESLMLAPEIHDEYFEFLKKPLKFAMFDVGEHIPASSHVYGRTSDEPYLADLSKMQQIAERQWKKYEAEYRRLGGKYPHAG